MKYELIIKEIATDNTVFKKECDCVCGAVAGIDGEDVVASTLSTGEGTIAAHFACLAATQDACDKLENDLYEEFKTFYKQETPVGLFKEFIEAIRSKGVTIDVEGEGI